MSVGTGETVNSKFDICKLTDFYCNGSVPSVFSVWPAGKTGFVRSHGKSTGAMSGRGVWMLRFFWIFLIFALRKKDKIELPRGSIPGITITNDDNNQELSLSCQEIKTDRKM